MHALRFAHTLLCTHYAHAAQVGSNTCYTSLGFGPYRGDSCCRVEDAAVWCVSRLALMITDVQHLWQACGLVASVILWSPKKLSIHCPHRWLAPVILGVPDVMVRGPEIWTFRVASQPPCYLMMVNSLMLPAWLPVRKQRAETLMTSGMHSLGHEAPPRPRRMPWAHVKCGRERCKFEWEVLQDVTHQTLWIYACIYQFIDIIL